MFELPEMITLAGQMNEALKGKTILRGQLGNSPHKFVWYNRVDAEEQMMIEQFGEQYIAYMEKTGRFFPRVL
jgi:predicted PolB exonuclease-like 3'-5' exonuclease